MNTKKLLPISLVLLCIVALGATSRDKYVPKPDEELYGTWTNKQYDPSWQHQKSVVTAVGEKRYARATDTVPLEESTLHVDAKWIDTDGNIWYKVYGVVTFGPYTGYNWQALEKISKSGAVRETQLSTASQYDPEWYPTELKPDDTYTFYKVRYRDQE
jgi:hypothetical protein